MFVSYKLSTNVVLEDINFWHELFSLQRTFIDLKVNLIREIGNH